jgi:flavin-dependent dehydrogenase
MPKNETQIREKLDVVVVGSGPAGASAAKSLSGHGLKIMLLEKAKLPRYKMCSGVLSPSSVKFVSDHFGKIPPHAVSTPEDFMGARVHTAIGGKVVDVRFDTVDRGPGFPSKGMLIRRAEFDYWLATMTEAEIVEQCRFKAVEKTDPDVVMIVEHKGMDRMITAKYLVGADGVVSRVRTSLSPDFNKSVRMIPNYEEWYRGAVDLEPGWLNVFLDGKLTSYFASVIYKDGMVIVANGAKPPESVTEYFQALVEYLKKNHGLVIKEKVASHGCVVHNMAATGNFHLGKGNILLAGEAGGFFRVLDEGISSALLTGKAAAEAILKSMETGKPALEHYKEYVAPELDLCSMLNRMTKEFLGMNPFTR